MPAVPNTPSTIFHGSFEPLDMRKKHLLLFEHVRPELFGHRVKHKLDGSQLGMVLVMAAADFLQQPF